MEDPSAVDLQPWNTTGGTVPDPSSEENEQFVYICSALFSFCYLLAGVICCRCYWLHLRKKLEGNRNPEGVHHHKTSVAARKEEAKDVPDLLEVSVEEDNEFLETKCC